MSIRWQDWASVMVGIWLVASPWQLEFTLNLPEKGNACGLGAALIIFNLISACRKVDEGQEILNILMGIWLIMAPFAFSFYTDKNVSLNLIVSGVVVTVLASWQMFDTIRKSKKIKAK